MIFVVRAAMAVLLLLGAYVLAAGLVAVLGFAVYEGFVHGFGGVLLGKGAGLLLILTLALGRALWAARIPKDLDPDGIAISPDDQPRLWEEVRAIATTVGTRAPDEIRLVAEVNAAVTEESRWLGLVGGRRVMYVGAPLMMGLTTQQLRAVLAHELGHFSHRHMALKPIAYRGQMSLGSIAARLGRDTLTGKVFAAYGRLYLRLTQSVSRRQEVEADAWSARVAGRTASAQAMRELAPLSALWHFLLERHAFVVDGVRPLDLFDGYGRLLDSPQRRREMDEMRRELPVEVSDPYDSHPPLAARIAYFESRPDDGLADNDELALALLDRVDSVLRELEDEFFADSGLEPRTWQSIAETAGLLQAREMASLLVLAHRESGLGATDLRDAIIALGRGNARTMVRPYLEPDTSVEETDEMARMLVRAVVSAALVEHCGARYSIDWDTNEALLDPDGHRIDVTSLVDAVTDMDAAQRLIRVLAEEGVPMSFAVDPRSADLRGDGEPVVQSIAACAHWRRLRIVVVAENALIVKRIGWGESLVAVLRHGSMDPMRTVVRHVASIPLPKLLEDPRAEVFTWDRVGAATVSGRVLALTLDGRVRRVRVETHTIAGDDLVDSLRQHLGDQFVLVA